MKKVYLDHASTTPVDTEVINAMTPYTDKIYGNASSIHDYGVEAADAIEEARGKIAKSIGARPEEIVFTAGGSESDNLAIKGISYRNKKRKKTKGPHVITSAIEHPAVLETCKYLEKQGFAVAYIPVDKDGLLDPQDVHDAITKDTILITIMYANNEIGTIEPIAEIGNIAHDHNVLFHTDAVQAIGKVPIDVKKEHVDLLSISSHKIYGPKGVGALYIKKGVKLDPIIHGGGHENGVRSGTYNTPGIVGLGKACELGTQRMSVDGAHMTKLRDRLISEILNVEESYLNGHPKKRLANNAHFRFTAIEGESLNLLLNEQGIAAATGSACSSKKLEASHVLLALGLEPAQAHGSLRFSLGRTTTDDDISYVIDVVPKVVAALRQMSPLWNR
ncbi:MAG: cysteine desulfurase NifS [Candidatus Thermoplasmatota archaeon]|nr:cysteine desulfurase NifS [Candidatus Thermoplasmatota archaeon]